MRLERSCDWMRGAPPAPGLERFEAYFSGHGFDPHRHDTYAIGATITGVQTFRYRGAARRSLPGQVFVLHPDETHDGRAGTRDGFRYRILYLEPRLIGAALGALPFVREAVSEDRGLARALRPALEDLTAPLEALRRDQIICEIADALASLDGSVANKSPSRPHRHAVRQTREFLDSHLDGVTSTALEAVSGMSRYALARHFRACLGTSPYRYLVMRRLDHTRALIRAGVPLAEAAQRSGFADQSHMTRQFKQAYGVSPGRWAAMARSSRSEPRPCGGA